MTSTALPDRFRVRIQRQDKPEAEPYWHEFEIARRANLNVTSVLQEIAAFPLTVEGEEVRPPVWEASCLEEVCGSCTFLINGWVRQGCSTLVDEMLPHGGTITLSPMTKFPVVRDLIVDRSRMFNALHQVRAWVPVDSTQDLGEGPTETPGNQRMRYDLSRCMTCGCCLEACPQFTEDSPFIGAQAIGQALLFNRHETGRELADERLDLMSAAGGITDCGNAQNCVKVCPKEVPLTEAIAHIGRQTTVHNIKGFFSGRG